MPMRFGSFRAFEGDGSGWVSGGRRLLPSAASAAASHGGPVRKRDLDEDDGARARRRPVDGSNEPAVWIPSPVDAASATAASTAAERRCRRRCLRLFALQQPRTSPCTTLSINPGHRQYVWPGVHEARLRAYSRSEHRTPYGGWRAEKRITCDVALALGAAKDPL